MIEGTFALQISNEIVPDFVTAKDDDLSTSDFIFSVPDLLVWLSRYVTLEVGDLIFTGTPGGVGDSMEPPTYLRNGQIVEAKIEGIGSIRNRFVSGSTQ